MIGELLIALSFLIAAYQDFKERAVNDLVWIPGAVGVAYILYFSGPFLEFQVIKLILFGGIGLGFVLLVGIGEADGIALLLMAGDPNPFSPIPPLIFTGVAFATHAGYQFGRGNVGRRTQIPIERFEKEPWWIPKATVVKGVRTEVSRDVNTSREEVQGRKVDGMLVEVSYGVPTVAYLGVGYAAYLVYAFVSSPALLLSLP